MNPFCAAVDWGTSRFRLWLLAEDGSVLHETRTDEGLQTSANEGFEKILEAHLAASGAPADLPVVVCGMAGSRQGWMEAPYLTSPVSLEKIIGAAVRLPTSRDIRILPGIAQRNPEHPDVMRGEETQLLGLHSEFATDRRASPGLVCMPGTHSKWVVLDGGIVLRFTTFMTGEIFNLLSRQSVLASMTKNASKVSLDDPAFLGGVEYALDKPHEITSRLFSLRASNLLGLAPAEAGAAGLSGLLIGAELAGAFALHTKPSQINLFASGNLGNLYQCALKLAGVESIRHDAEQCGHRGMFVAAKTFWLNENAAMAARSR